MHPFIPVLSPSFLYHPYIPSFKSKDFSFTCIYILYTENKHCLSMVTLMFAEILIHVPHTHTHTHARARARAHTHHDTQTLIHRLSLSLSVTHTYNIFTTSSHFTRTSWTEPNFPGIWYMYITAHVQCHRSNGMVVLTVGHPLSSLSPSLPLPLL